jgi:tetratricopeptide (TPR) repeat protein
MKEFLARLSRKNLGVKTVAPVQAAVAPLTPTQCVEAALAHHRAGRLSDAESLYREALAFDAESFDALHLLGVLYQQSGNSAKAVEVIGRAISLVPASSSAHSNLGLAYRALNRPDDAEACFAIAVQLNPSSTEALNNLGNIRKDREQFPDAEALYRKALAINPELPAIWKNLGQVLQQEQQFDDAADCYEKALNLRPNDASVLLDIGTLHSARGDLPEAERYFRLALQFDGNLVEAMCNLGDVLGRLDRLDQAEQFCRDALAIRPDYPDALISLAAILMRNFALDEAESYCRKALSLRPDHAPAQTMMGIILNARERPVDAEECFRLAMRLSPKSAVARYNLSMTRLLRGDYKEGFALYESRFGIRQGDFGSEPGKRALQEDARRWRGEPLCGKRLLIWAEQGYGDTLMMLRYLPMLSGHGAGPVIVLCEHELKRVVQFIAGLKSDVSCKQSISADEFDLHCPIMSLPFLFGTTLDSVPAGVPYLDIPPQLSRKWQGRLLSVMKPRVGLAWAGSRTLRDDARRSIPLSSFEPILTSDAINFVSLQKGDGAEEVGRWRGWVEDWMDACDDFLDTAALVNNLDLVITVDTAVAHLAGALGKPVWLLNRCGSEWRWGLDSERSPWYPSMRIFRQTEAASWDGLIARVANELTKLQRTQLDQA